MDLNIRIFRRIFIKILTYIIFENKYIIDLCLLERNRKMPHFWNSQILLKIFSSDLKSIDIVWALEMTLLLAMWSKQKMLRCDQNKKYNIIRLVLILNFMFSYERMWEDIWREAIFCYSKTNLLQTFCWWRFWTGAQVNVLGKWQFWKYKKCSSQPMFWWSPIAF